MKSGYVVWVNSSQLIAVHIPLAITDIGLSGGRNASNGWRNQTKTPLVKLLHALYGVVFATGVRALYALYFKCQSCVVVSCGQSTDKKLREGENPQAHEITKIFSPFF